jgi:hypothetical protein
MWCYDKQLIMMAYLGIIDSSHDSQSICVISIIIRSCLILLISIGKFDVIFCFYKFLHSPKQGPTPFVYLA